VTAADSFVTTLGGPWAKDEPQIILKKPGTLRTSTLAGHSVHFDCFDNRKSKVVLIVVPGDEASGEKDCGNDGARQGIPKCDEAAEQPQRMPAGSLNPHKSNSRSINRKAMAIGA
jgi:hypothetical protein